MRRDFARLMTDNSRWQNKKGQPSAIGGKQSSMWKGAANKSAAKTPRGPWRNSKTKARRSVSQPMGGPLVSQVKGPVAVSQVATHALSNRRPRRCRKTVAVDSILTIRTSRTEGAFV